MKKKIMTGTCSSTYLWTRCTHNLAYKFNISFWIFTKKLVFCELCHQAMTEEEWEATRKH